MPGIEELNQKYKDRDVAFFVVYSKEPHAGERRYFKKYTQHSSYEHKLGYAKELVETFGMKVPVLVDDLEESVVMAYGRMPNMIYIIGPDGTVAFRGHWNNPKAVRKVLDTLLNDETVAGMRSPFRMVSPLAMKAVLDAGSDAFWDMALCMPKVMWIHFKQEARAAFS